LTPQNADENNPLRGGTQTGGQPAPLQVGGTSGGTNSVSPTGASQNDLGPAAPPSGPTPERRGIRTGARDDAEAIFDTSRHQSESTAKQFARDEADADTQPGTPHRASEPRHHQIVPTEKSD
jgi:hypothetical protein